MVQTVHIIGGGLAGSEAAWQLVNRGIAVVIHEMRPKVKTAVHKTGDFAELVCSNSFRGSDVSKNAVGVLHEELRRMDSLIMATGETARVPAGGAFAVDRDIFSSNVTKALTEHPLVTVEYGEVTSLPEDAPTILATGPLTTTKLAEHILTLADTKHLSFFDAVAPIIAVDSIDMSKAWKQSRYDKGDGSDYINCPLDKEQYFAFIDAIINAEHSVGHNPEDKDTPYFEGCLPIEVMAQRGVETLRFGPMKPKGLTNSHNPTEKAYAVVQLRQDNKLGTLYNMVGFQTQMKWGEQKRILRTIPGLENAEIVRYGVIHKNTFINSPTLLDEQMRLKARPNVRVAGQVSGVEGYVESTAMGALAGILTAHELMGTPIDPPPATSMTGALISHITFGADAKTFQPMNINYGLLPPLDYKHNKKERKPAYGERALTHFDEWLKSIKININVA